MKKLTILAIALIATIAKADPILFDTSPDAYPTAILHPSTSGNWANGRFGQHFADSFSFASNQVVTGMGLYSGRYWGSLGQTVTIQLWADSAGAPGTLLNEFQETIDAINTDGASSAADITQKYVDFTSPLALTGSTLYWISMSGGDSSSYSELALLGLVGAGAPGDGSSVYVNGNTVGSLGSYGDVSMRLYGVASSVPDGGMTVGFIGATLMGMLAFRRKLGSAA